MNGWRVFLGNKLLDIVFYDRDMDADEVRRSLISHDHFDDRISVVLDS